MVISRLAALYRDSTMRKMVLRRSAKVIFHVLPHTNLEIMGIITSMA